jgi:hypothetical protein
MGTIESRVDRVWPRVRVALWGYVAVAVFGLALLGINLYGRTSFGAAYGPTFSTSEELLLAVVAVLPLILAFVWDRLKSFKIMELEIELSDVEQRYEPAVPEAIRTWAPESIQSSGLTEIVKQVSAVVVDPQLGFVSINLQTGDYWWANRVYLVAALLSTYTDDGGILFLAGSDDAPRYVGAARPVAVRGVLSRRWPELESQFAAALNGVATPPRPNMVAQTGAAAARPTAVEEMARVQALGEAFRSLIDAPPFIATQERISEGAIVDILGDDLDRATVPWVDDKITADLIRAIIASPARSVALTRNGVFVELVDRAEVGYQASLQMFKTAG